jgi:hypothetical protein
MAMTLSGDTGIVQPTAAAPTFSAYKSGSSQSLASTFVKVTFETEEFDTNSNFASSRFTPTVAGYYSVNSSIRTNNNGQLRVAIYKNGSNAKEGLYEINTFTSSVNAIISMNGSTDYLEIYAYSPNGHSATAGSTDTYFQAALIRSA